VCDSPELGICEYRARVSLKLMNKCDAATRDWQSSGQDWTFMQGKPSGRVVVGRFFVITSCEISVML